MGITEITALLATHGPFVIYSVFVTLAYRDKDREVRNERNDRIQDAKDYTKALLELQSKVMDSVDKLSDILDEMKRLNPPGMGRR